MEKEAKPLRGMKFPVEADLATGRFKECAGAECIRQSLYLILMTQRTERAAHPEYGSDILSYPFSDMSATVMHMRERRLQEALQKQEPRITDVEVHMEKEKQEEKLYVRVSYRIRGEEQKEQEVFSVPAN